MRSDHALFLPNWFRIIKRTPPKKARELKTINGSSKRIEANSPFNTRHMAQIAAHLVDNVFPKVPVRQWVLSFPKRIRYFLHHNPEITGTVLNILITAVESQMELGVLNDGNKKNPIELQ